MQDYFEREIGKMERELTQLKTASQRSSSAVGTVSKTVTVTTAFEWVDTPLPTGYGLARAEKAYEINVNEDAIIIPTLSWYCSDLNIRPELSRGVHMTPCEFGSGKYGIWLNFSGTYMGDNSDAARAKRGETVTVSVDLNVVCTEDFTFSEVL